jgi:hypothetical protein
MLNGPQYQAGIMRVSHQYHLDINQKVHVLNCLSPLLISVLFSGEFLPVPYLILELATNTPRIFTKKGG